MSVMVFRHVWGGSSAVYVPSQPGLNFLCVSTVSLLANQDNLSFWQRRLWSDQQRITAVPGLSVLLSHSLSSESLVSSSLSQFSSIRAERRTALQFLSRGHCQWAWKCFEVEALSELNTHPPSISLRFLVCSFCLNGDSCCPNVF